MPPSPAYFRYWGKTRRGNRNETAGPLYHLLPYHGLDVAAVGRTVLLNHIHLTQTLADRFGMTFDGLVRWITFFLAIHDIGKFSEAFQGLDKEVYEVLRDREPFGKAYAVRHDSLGQLLWIKEVWSHVKKEDWFGLAASGVDEDHIDDFKRIIPATFFGHHGQPPYAPHQQRTRQFFEPEDIEAALAYIKTVRSLILGDTPPSLVDPDQMENLAPLSWWLAGIAVLSDWLGSNAKYFPFEDRHIDLSDYWNERLERAKHLIPALGLLPQPSGKERDFAALFPTLAQYQPTPLQKLAQSFPIVPVPQLFILEDVTGAGKTEAGFMLAQRLIATGQAQGVYIGMPTMATANAMYDRTADVYRRFFADNAHPSLVLAHSARRLSKTFQSSVLPEPSPDLLEDYTVDDASAETRCAAWLADSPKKALLAQVGVGTLDQALLAILHSRHQSLRLLGLWGKVLIVDEVHACDRYMLQLLETLLKLHAQMGGSAILLSATLPRKTRAALIKAFCKGQGVSVSPLQRDDYPLLTHVAPGATKTPHEQPVDTRPDVRRTVTVHLESDEQEVIAHLCATANAGGCTCWIRNTVDDTVRAFHNLQDKISPDQLHLFHARFPMGRRLEIEKDVLERFGPNSKAENRKGQILIATQVVEQSLDLDFDELVSDLAPIDALIQRAGRLRRHRRYRSGDRIADADGHDERGTPTLWVHGPSPEGEIGEDWYRSMFPGGAAVYPDHGQLWLTTDLLRRGTIAMPDDARFLIEGVYGEEADERIPTALQKSHDKQLGEDQSKVSLGRMNAINSTIGYEPIEKNADWWREVVTPTRLGEPSVTLRLARWDGKALHPWSKGEHQWEMSEVRILERYVKTHKEPQDAMLKSEIHRVQESMLDKGRWSVLLPLVEVEAGTWHGETLNAKDEIAQVRYRDELGLWVERDRN